MLAVPRLPLLMIAAGVLRADGPACWSCSIGLAGWMETARVVRAEFLTLAQRAASSKARAPPAPATRA